VVTSFHLRGRGLPRVNASGTGDLHVRVQLWTPERVTDEERNFSPLASFSRESGRRSRQGPFGRR
jgi:DnaJ-class molecular chaperone